MSISVTTRHATQTERGGNRLKRCIDFLAATVLGILLLPLVALACLLAAIDTRSSGIFCQQRVGFNGHLFTIFKLRTMRTDTGAKTTVTASDDIRITAIGRQLRRFKLDELPQLLNVIRGEMALVGPRPDVQGYANLLSGEERAVLSVRPGITGPAQLLFREEEELLSLQADPESFNDNVLYPLKTRANLEYVRSETLLLDVRLILATVGIGSLPQRFAELVDMETLRIRNQSESRAR